MRHHGKKIGKFSTSTVLAKYDLDVRLDMEANVFRILVPNSPGKSLDPKHHGPMDYESFSAPTLEEVKKAVVKFLRERDVTTFVDVIEYNYRGREEHAFLQARDQVGFEFRVARVSVAHARNERPSLEIEVNIGETGTIAVAEHFGEAAKPEPYSSGFDSSMEFSVSRWRKCCEIRDGITRIEEMLFALLGEEGKSAEKLDAIGEGLLLLGTSRTGKDES